MWSIVSKVAERSSSVRSVTDHLAMLGDRILFAEESTFNGRMFLKIFHNSL